MKSWMFAVLTLCLAGLLMTASWGIFRLLDSAEAVVGQGRLMMASIRGTTAQVHQMAQDGVKVQRDMAAAMKNLSDAGVAAIGKMADSTARSMTRLAAGIERMSGTLEGRGGEVLAEAALTIRAAREEIVPRAGAAVDEIRMAVAGIRPVLGEAQGVLAETRGAVAGISGETQQTIAGVRPILDSTDYVVRQLGEIAESGSNVAKHYEKMILHPSFSQRMKGILQMVLSGFTVWGNAKIIF